ncbi:recombination directionality factor [Nonomuraea cavernae]|uniref:Uncharacterized protein n=1 Tax=Nonomuraea cavernae TaxID=2045107 RepID=A0A917YR09_9ACTN|nr:hypothetical protein [Nonomuraea cavernae]MCA2184686.1 hypothetical protein [Nonomuraea cavernae]GGO63064.1 hypothetical protein GCM10012289_09110 [Nonomuraea cavernae]
MGGRIKDLQHRMRTIGRIRLGTYEGRPKASEFFIPTSEFEHFIRQLADIYGGDVEQWKPQGDGGMQWRLMNPDLKSLDAIIPPLRDPLDQAYEKWSRGGKQARCDGETVANLGRPCVCKAQWGPRFWENAPPQQACKLHTRLNIWIPEIQDIGTWLLETKGANAGKELPGFVDMIQAMFGTKVAVPISLWLVPGTAREKGKLKLYTKVEAAIRGMTSMQAAARIMAAAPEHAELGAGASEDRLAIESGKPEQTDYIGAIRVAQTRETVTHLWRQAKADRDTWMTSGAKIEAEAAKRAKEIDRLAEAWKDVVTAWEGGNMDALHAEFADFSRGRRIEEATADELVAFLKRIQPAEPDEAQADKQAPPVQAPAGRSTEDIVVPPDDDVVDADVVDDPQVAKERLPRLNIMIGERGIASHTGKGSTAANKAAKAEWLTETVKRPVESTADLTESEADTVMARLKSMPITNPGKPKQATAEQPQQQDPAERRTHMLHLFGQLGITGDDMLRDISIIAGTTVTMAAPPTPEQINDAIDVLESATGDPDAYDTIIGQIQEARAQQATN